MCTRLQQQQQLSFSRARADDISHVSLWYLLALTCPNLGIQVLWLVMMSYGTPYMTGRLGMPTSVTSLVWLAGPLSGTLAHPLFAGLSDRSQHPWGKRKPFIVAGTSCACLSLLGLAYTEDVKGWFTGVGRQPEADGMRADPFKASLLTQLLVITWACMLCLAIQPLQCGVRALIVDSIPPHQQNAAAAWSARFNGLGALLISGLAFLGSRQLVPLLGEATFKGLCVIGAVALLCTVCIVCYVIEDRPTGGAHRPSTPTSLVTGAWRTAKLLPPVTKQVCKVQFCAWLGWFIVLYYSTTYVYQTFVIEEHVHLKLDYRRAADDGLVKMGEQAGYRASFVTATVSFGVSIILPLLSRTSPSSTTGHEAPVVRMCGLSIARLWRLAHMLFAVLMLLTFFVSTTAAATVIVGTLAISWAISSWVPYALISAEIAALKPTLESEKTNGLREYDEMSASIMSIHNISVSLPQILAALVCSALFKAVELTGRGDPVSFAFKFAGVMAAVAAYLGGDLEREIDNSS